LGAFPVRTSGSSRGALKEALRFLKDGNALLIFPEGEREFSDGKLLNFKTGAARIATRANIPILPVTIRGGHKIWARNHKIPKCRKVEIIYHPILKPSDYKNRLKGENQVEKLNSKLKEIILSEM
jgi:1-acyl-sn-glycerol-3-phosphate acyltransferase